MILRIFLQFILLIICVSASFAVDIRLTRVIEIIPRQAEIGDLSSFVVTDEGAIFVLDFKMSNIKLLDCEGRWIRSFGRKGQGPDEFDMPLYCDYQPPYFTIMDFGKRKIFIYKLTSDLTFMPSGEMSCLALGSDLKIHKDDILIAGYAMDKIGSSYELYGQSWANKTPRFLLPSLLKYGFSSQNDFLRHYRENDDIVAIGTNGYIDVVADDIYYIWEGSLKVFHLRSDGKMVKFFGQASDNFIRPSATKALMEAYRSHAGKILVKERRKSTQIIGLFADAAFIGILYANFKQPQETWTIYLQLYSPGGKLIEERALVTGTEEERFANRPYFYLPSQKTLFILIHKLASDFSENSRILLYKIRAS